MPVNLRFFLKNSISEIATGESSGPVVDVTAISTRSTPFALSSKNCLSWMSWRLTLCDEPSGNVNCSVAGWADHAVFTQRVRNYSGKAIELEVRRRYAGDVVIRSGLNPTLHDYQSPEFVATVDPGKRADLLFEIVTRQGHSAKQEHVTLEAAEVKAQ